MDTTNYKELLTKALKEPTTENLESLANWCDRYGNCWNGECYDISDIGAPSGSRLLYPVYSEEPDKYDNYPIVGYEIR